MDEKAVQCKEIGEAASRGEIIQELLVTMGTWILFMCSGEEEVNTRIMSTEEIHDVIHALEG